MGEESKIEKAVTRYAKSKGYYARKFKSPSNRGVPDHLYLAPSGSVVFIEFKAPGKKPTDLQEREMNMIKQNLGNAFAVDSVEFGCELINLFY